MFNKKFYYLIKIQFLGYRFHGWQKQPDHKTIHLMIDRTLKFVLEGRRFKSLGTGRTDAMVSAEETAIELFLYKEPLEDMDAFLKLFNHNLPQDIRALSIEAVDQSFNIIQDVKRKEYHYLFAFGDKFHPFCAPFMTTILDPLDIELMQQGARLFQGEHDFKSYCYKSTDEGEYIRTIEYCELVENQDMSASFFPEKTFVLKVSGKGFGRHQIRLMMGALISLGKGEINLNTIENSLKTGNTIDLNYIAPASGLILKAVNF